MTRHHRICKTWAMSASWRFNLKLSKISRVEAISWSRSVCRSYTKQHALTMWLSYVNSFQFIRDGLGDVS